MTPELQRTTKANANEQNPFAQQPFTSGRPELLQEKGLQASSQDIIDLYAMLRFKCTSVAPRGPGFQL